MSCKTEFSSYNEDNFIEREGKLHELTVEITLEEYRNLITERCYNEQEIAKLQEENKKLQEAIETLSNIYIEDNPELKSALDLIITKSWCDIKKAMKDGEE